MLGVKGFQPSPRDKSVSGSFIRDRAQQGASLDEVMQAVVELRDLVHSSMAPARAKVATLLADLDLQEHVAPGDINGVFAASVLRLRKERLWNQSVLAIAMTAQGHPFYQPTVQRIEAGKRPVRLSEAYSLALLFGTTVDRMTGHSSCEGL